MWKKVLLMLVSIEEQRWHDIYQRSVKSPMERMAMPINRAMTMIKTMDKPAIKYLIV